MPFMVGNLPNLQDSKFDEFCPQRYRNLLNRWRRAAGLETIE